MGSSSREDELRLLGNQVVPEGVDDAGEPRPRGNGAPHVRAIVCAATLVCSAGASWTALQLRRVGPPAARTSQAKIGGQSSVVRLWPLPTFDSNALPPTQPPPIALSAAPKAAPQVESAVETGSEANGKVCAKHGEECQGMLCCANDGYTCYEKDDYFAGCRPSCTAGAPEAGGGDAGPWSCAKAKQSCACRNSCTGENGCPAFPEIQFIYLPEVAADNERYEVMTKEYDEHVPCGHETMKKRPGVNPELWPEGKGRYDEVQKWAEQLIDMPIGSSVWVGYNEIKIEPNSPWYYKKRLIYAEVNEQKQSTWVLKGLKHHAGCTLTHFITWMDARERGVDHFIISESDATFSQWWTPYSHGDPDEFSSVVQALLEDVPQDWDIIFLDKGKMGVKKGAQPVHKMSRECWSTTYDIWDWTGEGMAGAAFYIVSHRFLDKLPQVIHDSGLDMVDAWLGSRCKPEDGGQFKCFSVQATSQTTEKCDKMCLAGGQAVSCSRRIWAKAQEGGNPKEKCSDANSFVHDQCSMCADCWLEEDDCAGEAAPAGGGGGGDGGSAAAGGDEPAEAIGTPGCKQDCTFEGQSATCGARLQYVIENDGGLSGQEVACEKAWGVVRDQCEECGKCKLDACPDLKLASDDGQEDEKQEQEQQPPAPAPDDADDANAPEPEECDRDCVFDSVMAKCGDRIKYSASLEGGTCEKAQKLVSTQCVSCSACTSQAAGCTD